MHTQPHDNTPTPSPREARTAEPTLERPVYRCHLGHEQEREGLCTTIVCALPDGAGIRCLRHTSLVFWEALPGERQDPLIGSPALQRVHARPELELARLHALLVSHERRLGSQVSDPSRPRVAMAAARLWSSLRSTAGDVLALIAAMDEADEARRALAAGLDALEAAEAGR